MPLTGKDRDVGEVLVRSLQNIQHSINEKLENSSINLFGQKPKVPSEALGDAQGTNKDVEQDGKLETLDKYQPVDSDGSESSDQDEDGDATDSEAINRDHIKEQIEFHNGRQRRKAIFGSDADQSDLMVSLKVLYFMYGTMFQSYLLEVSVMTISFRFNKESVSMCTK